jgi:hypothetical protein
MQSRVVHARIFSMNTIEIGRVLSVEESLSYAALCAEHFKNKKFHLGEILEEERKRKAEKLIEPLGQFLLNMLGINSRRATVNGLVICADDIISTERAIRPRPISFERPASFDPIEEKVDMLKSDLSGIVPVIHDIKYCRAGVVDINRVVEESVRDRLLVLQVFAFDRSAA